jgi:hypothetical protein
MSQPPGKPRIRIVLPSKVELLREFRRHCAFVKVLVLLILMLPAIGVSAAAVLYAAHYTGLLRPGHVLQSAGADAKRTATTTTSATTLSTRSPTAAGS